PLRAVRAARALGRRRPHARRLRRGLQGAHPARRGAAVLPDGSRSLRPARALRGEGRRAERRRRRAPGRDVSVAALVQGRGHPRGRRRRRPRAHAWGRRLRRSPHARPRARAPRRDPRLLHDGRRVDRLRRRAPAGRLPDRRARRRADGPDDRPAADRTTAPGAARMKFGWMTLSLSPTPEDDLERVHQQLEQGVLAEAVGFDYLWLTEHNFTGECSYADPIPFAGALAARTSRVRLGFAVIQMALHHPVRLAIQLAVLDNLSRGRCEVGIGRGSSYNEYEYVGFGLRSDDSRERMDEAVEVLTRAWTEEPFVHEGKFFSVRLPSVRPRPVQRPHPPIWPSV